jgi:TPR repeat protein
MVRKAWVLPLLIAAAAAVAAPEDDYARGRQAYAAGDVAGAMRALRGGANAGHGPSMALLGFILERSDFVDEALALYRRAAALGVPDAHVALGNLHLAGRGVAKDENAALAHFSEAARLGDAHAAALVSRLRKGAS